MPTGFSQPVAPTPDQLMAHIHANTPVQSAARRYAFFIMLGLLVGSFLAGTVSLALQAMLIFAAMGMVGWMFVQRRSAMQVQLQLQQLHEMILLRHDTPASQLAWQLLPRLRHLPDAHVQTVMMLSVSCARLHAYGTAIAAHNYLLEHISPAHPTTQIIRLQQVMAMLHEDHLVDADDAIRRLQRADLPDAGRAMLQLASLYQQIKTHHHADVTGQAAAFASSFKLLGVEAGYGYGMLATAFHHQQQSASASDYWHQATLLLPSAVIMRDIPETSVCRDLPPAPSLLNCMEQDRNA